MDDAAAPFVGVVCGLVSEAGLLSGKPVQVRPVAGDAARATEEVHTFADEGATVVFSFGLAGGLAAECRPGALIIADAVAVGAERLPCDPRLTGALSAVLPDSRTATVAGSDGAVLTVAAKAALAEDTGAVAVDMESHAVALSARKLGLPFAVLRAVADPADRPVPPLALKALRADGTTGAWPVVKGLIWRPSLIPAMMRLGADSKAAHRSLARAVEAGVVAAMLRAIRG